MVVVSSVPVSSSIGGMKNRDLDVVDVVCQLQAGKAIIRVAYDPAVQVNGFVVLPGK
jgi:hypothetical protein